jgi:hypothetical protein
MQAEPAPSITESPWYWVLAFSLMALLSLVVIGPKYGRRQSALERKYQAREWIEDARQARNSSNFDPRTDEIAARRQFATPGDTLVPLWPLAAILVVVVLFSIYMLRRGREHSVSLRNEGSPP